jgi:predicted TIM-barrel fold metal-dependent hydrolase
MIIDAHAHLYSSRLLPPFWIQAMAEYGHSISGRTTDEVRQRIETDWFDETGDRLVADMNEAGIDRTIVFAIDFGPFTGVEDAISLTERYSLFHEATKRHEGRIILFGGIDPRRPDAAAFIERAVGQWDIKGIKIWPPAGVYPNEACCYRVYEKCAALNLPVVIHTGQEISPLRSECARPIYCDQPANDFPEIVFILAHAGMAWWEEAADVAWHHPNVYLDIAYWQGKYLKSERMFIRQLRDLISIAGKNRVLFGSDWPATRTVARVRPQKWIETLKGLAENSLEGVEFEEEEIQLMLGGNAERVLNLSGEGRTENILRPPLEAR